MTRSELPRFVFSVLLSGLTASCGESTTGPVTVSRISVSAVTGPLIDGESLQLVATPRNGDGEPLSDVVVSWRSSDVSIATVNSSGLVLGVGIGLVDITASAGKVESPVRIDVRPGGRVATQGGTLNMLGGSLLLEVPSGALGDSTLLSFRRPYSTPPNARIVPGTWYVLDASGATFTQPATLSVRYNPAMLPPGVEENALQLFFLSGQQGEIGGVLMPLSRTAVDPASNTVSAKVSGEGTYVVAGAVVDHLRIVGGTGDQAVAVGQVTQLVAKAFDGLGAELSGVRVTWSSSDPSRATIDDTGRVTGISVGDVTMTASLEGKILPTMLTIIPRVTADWSHATEWTTFQGNATHTGYVPVTIDPSVIAERWVTNVVPESPLNSVAAGDGRVFVSSGFFFGLATIAAVNVTNGAVEWSRVVETSSSTMPPAYADGVVYVQTNNDDSYLWGLDATTGETRFRVKYPSQWFRYQSPVVAGDKLYMGCGTFGGVCAQRTSDGSNIWFAENDAAEAWSPTLGNGLVYTYPNTPNPGIVATDAETGEMVFGIADPHRAREGYGTEKAPALSEGNNLLATTQDRLVSFDVGNRRIGWEVTSGFKGQVTVGSGFAYVLNIDYDSFKTVRLDVRKTSDGSRAWSWNPPPEAGQPVGEMVVTNNLLFITTQTTTFAVDLASHRRVWQYPAAGKLALSSQGVLFISQTSGKVVCITLR